MLERCSFLRVALPLAVFGAVLGLPSVGMAQPCVVQDDGTGTVSLPPEGCEYLSPDEVHAITNGLPPGTTIELGAIHLDFICRKTGGNPNHCGNPGGGLGGETEVFDSSLALEISGTGALGGYTRTVNVPVFCITETGPRNPGDPVQTFPTEMVQLQGELFGDPDFCVLKITGGSANGLPSPGQTTLTQLGGGDFQVDSFFDIAYRIEFQGCPGSPLDGMGGVSDGAIHMQAQGQQCGPTSDGTACQQVDCPATTERCVPSCVNYDPANNTSRVIECECRDATNSCFVDLSGARGTDDPCVVQDDGTGTVSLPPEGCEYLSPDDVHAITNGLPPGTTIELAAIHKDFICKQSGGNPNHCGNPGGSLGGEQEFFVSTATFVVNGSGALGGFSRTIDVPLFCETHTGPHNPGDAVQTFPTEMWQLQGQLFGDPDFCMLQITGGTGNGLPSPGQTTLTRVGPPGSDFQVDSFFDITYRIQYQGCPGSPLDGYAGVEVATIRMEAGGSAPGCIGNCPPGTMCERTSTVQADGTVDICCDCVPEGTEACCFPDGSCADIDPAACQDQGGMPQGPNTLCDSDGDGVDDACQAPDCGPNPDGTACLPAACDTAGEECVPRCVEVDPLTGALRVVACDCRFPNECHVGVPGTVAPRGAADPCVVADNGSGTVTLPPQGCEYLSPDEVHMIIDGLPAGTTIELAAIHKDFICHKQPTGGACSLPIPPGECETGGGTLGGNGDCFNSTVELQVNGTGSLAGFSRTLFVPVFSEVHTGPRNPGDPVQTFDNEMFRLQGELFGDPDFCTFRIQGGRDLGLPSPGQTTLTQLPGGNWAVDSFFDITYRIDFQGCPGSVLDGMAGSTTATIRMKTGAVPECVGACPPNTTCEQTTNVTPTGTIVTCCDCIPIPTVACCLPDGTCTEVGPQACREQLGGLPQGPGSMCEGDADGDGIDEACICEPRPTGDGCDPAFCPDPTTEVCLAACAHFDPATGLVQVTECDCRSPNECHLELATAAPTPGARGGSNPCVITDNGSGTVTLPPQGCEYLSPDEVHMILDGLPAGTTIEFETIHRDFICKRQDGTMFPGCPPPGICEEPGGPLGGQTDCFDSNLTMNVTGTGALAGFNRTLNVPVFSQVATGPRNPGDPIQTFQNDMQVLDGQLFGDPDFCQLQIVGGTANGLPSPGETTLTQLPGGNFAVDSFFDITYRIDFQGCPGSVLEGMAGSTTSTIRMSTGVGGPPTCVGACPTGTECVRDITQNTDGTYDLCCRCEAVCNSTSVCPNADVNCDNVVSGLDIAIITNSANFGLPVGAAANPRADVNGDGVVSGLDVAAAQSSACFGM